MAAENNWSLLRYAMYSGEFSSKPKSVFQNPSNFTRNPEKFSMTNNCIDVTGKYVIPGIGLVGLIGCVLTVVVVARIRVRTPSYMYILLLAIADFVSLFLEAIVDKGLSSWGISQWLDTSNFLCKSGKWIMHISSVAANNVLVLFSFDRYFAVSKPFKYRALWVTNLRYPVIVVFLNYFVVSLLLIPELFYFGLVAQRGDHLLCSVEEGIAGWKLSVHYYYVFLVLTFGLPFTLQLVLNFATIRAMRSHNRTWGEDKGRRHQGTEIDRLDRSTTNGLLWVSLASAALKLPTLIFALIRNHYLIPIRTENPKYETYTELINVMCSLTVVVDKTITFFIYVARNQSFRSALFELMMFWKKRERPSFYTTRYFNQSQHLGVPAAESNKNSPRTSRLTRTPSRDEPQKIDETLF